MIRTDFEQLYFLTHSNLGNTSFGDSNNDNKFISAIPKSFLIRKIYPTRDKDQNISLFQVFRFLINIIKASIVPNNNLIIRQAKPGYIPAIFKKIMKHKIILNMGCTPLYTTERIAFQKNTEYKESSTIINRILLYLEFQFEKLLLRKADLIFVENLKAKSILVKYGADINKIVLLPYYVQENFLKEPKSIVKYQPNQEFLIGYTGRFHKYDKIPLILDVLKKIISKHKNVKLILIGDGPTRKKIEQKVIQMKLSDNVKFLGSKPHNKMSELIEQFHCLLLPMIKHLCPSTIAIKILEGVVKGKIIITTNSGNNVYLFRPNIELILNNIDAESLSIAIENVIKNYEYFTEKAKNIRENQLSIRTKEFFQKKIGKELTNLLK
jgi:glycosyltransferase involved in cell wall biosynthesis